ncbi:hypothetical protein FH972_024312 [Carpinus fangiana]|uniref:FAD-binding domain-containing protein n=1 Tax=Carpinus fangiana TaxID=176857 RepID=A0A5N6KY73_9ROSI|nr:hypothetical protein FH972_024312 [Carpinus fangiana]
MASDSSYPRVAIIGAGPAGCTLARLLVRAALPVTIFEGEKSLDMRSQGGTLDLHSDTGIAALKAAGLYDDFIRQSRFDGDSIRLCDKSLRSYLNLGSSADSWFAQGKPEIDRSDLRMLLLNSLPKETVRWGHRLTSVDPVTLTLTFEDGTLKDGFDLIVGADGAWSKVRAALTTTQPFYSGVGGFTAVVNHAETDVPNLSKLINRGSWFNFSDGSMVLGQQMGDGSLYVSVWQVREEDWQKNANYDVKDGKSVRNELCKQYANWSPEVLELLSAISDHGVVPRSLYMLPVDFKWSNVPGITLLGDAAHLMTPFIGEGVNAGMKDAVDLAHAIVETSKSPDLKSLTKNITLYERRMFQRVGKVQVRTKDMMELMLFTPGAPGTVIDKWIVRSFSDEMNSALLLLVKTPSLHIASFRQYRRHKTLNTHDTYWGTLP